MISCGYTFDDVCSGYCILFVGVFWVLIAAGICLCLLYVLWLCLVGLCCCSEGGLVL